MSTQMRTDIVVHAIHMTHCFSPNFSKPLLKPSRFAESLLLGIVPRMTSRLFLQVEADQENTICPRETGVASFPGWMAANLSAAMLPALPPTVPRAALTPRPRSRAASRAKVETTNRDPRQPSLRFVIGLIWGIVTSCRSASKTGRLDTACREARYFLVADGEFYVVNEVPHVTKCKDR